MMEKGTPRTNKIDVSCIGNDEMAYTALALCRTLERELAAQTVYAERSAMLLREAMLGLDNRPMSMRVMSDSRLREAIAAHLLESASTPQMDSAQALAASHEEWGRGDPAESAGSIPPASVKPMPCIHRTGCVNKAMCIESGHCTNKRPAVNNEPKGCPVGGVECPGCSFCTTGLTPVTGTKE